MSSSDSETTCNHQEEDFAIYSDYENVSDGESTLLNRNEADINDQMGKSTGSLPFQPLLCGHDWNLQILMHSDS